MSVNAKTMKWIEEMRGMTDGQRAYAPSRILRVRNYIHVWELIRNQRRWLSSNEVAAVIESRSDMDRTLGRQARRIMLFLHAAGLADLQSGRHNAQNQIRCKR